MNICDEQNLKRFHEQFTLDHGAQRDRLLEKIAEEAIGSPRRKWLLPTAFSSIAAAIVAATALWLAWRATEDISWAAVAAQLQRMQTMSFTWTERTTYFHSDSVREMEPSVDHRYFRWPDQWRVETDGGELGMLENPTGYPNTTFGYRDGVLDSVQSRVTFGRSERAFEMLGNFFASLRMLNSSEVDRQGEETVDGRKRIRFEAHPGAVLKSSPEAHGQVTIWVDPATSLPTRVMVRFHPLNASDANERTWEMGNIQFDPAFPDDLFAGPDLSRTHAPAPNQWLFIEVPKRLSGGKLHMTITAPDGMALAIASDLTPPSATGRNERTLTRDAASRLAEFGRVHVGESLRIEIDSVGSERVRVWGPIGRVTVEAVADH